MSSHRQIRLLIAGAALMSACVPPQSIAPAPPSTIAPPPIPSVTPRSIIVTPTTAPLLPAPKPTLTPDARPRIETPTWFNTAVIYEIFPRSFYDTNGDGIGDLNGIRQKLDYVQGLGVNTIWLTPHYPSVSYHGYDVVDYFQVNPQFGTLDDFKALTAEMKRRNMRLIVDFVANHSSNAHPFFKSAYKNPASKYTSWYRFGDKANTVYESFFGTGYLPDWNTDNPEVRDYLINAALFWLSLGADGIRCDYALGVEPPFWRELRTRVKAKYPNAVILGEVWDASVLTLKRFFDDGFDALFDFPFYLTLTGSPDRNGDGVLSGKQPATLLQAPFKIMQRLYPNGAQLVRFASNHDTNRIASDSEGDGLRMKLAISVAMLTPGIPMIYYGEEIGMRGNKGEGPQYDEYRREPMDWYANETGAGMTTWFKPSNRHNRTKDGVSVEEQDKVAGSLLNYYRALGKLRSQYPSLTANSYSVVDNVGECDQCLALWRHSERESVLLLFNFSGQSQRIPFDPSTAPVPANSTPRHILIPTGEQALPITFDSITLAALDTYVMIWR